MKFYLLKNFQILNILWSNFSEYFAFDIIAMFGILLDITFDILYRIFSSCRSFDLEYYITVLLCAKKIMY